MVLSQSYRANQRILAGPNRAFFYLHPYRVVMVPLLLVGGNKLI